VTTRLGFVGLGIMGTPMAGHLAAAGYPLSVHDIDPAAAERFTKEHPGVGVGLDAASVGQHCDVVVTMLPDGEQVQRVALGTNGLAETMAAGSLLVDCSSAQPWLTRSTAEALAERGIAMIDAPVSGAQWGAERAELVFMVGGADDDVARARPVLDVLGRAVFHVGPLGAGHVMKCINNTITAMTLLATAEGLVLGTRAGLDPAAMNAVLDESTGGSWITRNHIEPRILTRTFDDPFKLELMLKDVRIAVQLARDLELDLPYAALAEHMYGEADDHAGPRRSLSELVRWVEHTSGVEIVPAGEPGSDRI
jgi:3-hydroxyisobutyrate dehydrogenase